MRYFGNLSLAQIRKNLGLIAGKTLILKEITFKAGLVIGKPVGVDSDTVEVGTDKCRWGRI